ncbi:hypothetical protein KPL78_19955 [Roseomonas sp. HJA6]|uniref:Thioesterase domain-containing protein n=1 Tax=Roseomonas alba TaxID=2846776 RepID=A0ABS7AG23_9PROT|nr:thioesterase domain-containing protein [Neoroseomonas alba]MBW6400144.1 hypothetical protein [Neoroseomonas alba]
MTIPPSPDRAALPRRAAIAGLLTTLAACGPTRLAPLAGPARGRVIVLRGLFNVFSTGMNVLTAQLRAHDFDAVVHNYIDWRSLAANVAAASRDGTLARPFAIIGHSFGADDAVAMANHLGGMGVAVDLLVTFDPTAAAPIGPGVLRVLNFYQDRDTAFVRVLAGGPGFTGALENRLVDGESHISIDKDRQLHAVIIAQLESLAAARLAPSPVVAPMSPVSYRPPAPPLPRPPIPPVRAGR